MTTRTVVLNIVGLDAGLLRDHAPRLRAVGEHGASRTITPVLPALTCSAQSTMVTGRPPSEHGIVGNGWYDRESNEIRFWKQSNRLVQGEKIWETARRRDPACTCCTMFWWYNMYASSDWAVTPRPMYPADGRKLPDIWTNPPELRDQLQGELGQFPLFRFWGPKADLTSSRWIAEASRIVQAKHDPTLHLIYIPHLDYALQQFGPDSPEAAQATAEIDALAGGLAEDFMHQGCRVLIVSEYGIGPVDDAVAPNRALRDAGLLAIRNECGREHLDPGASRAFAVADHQIAHVYVHDPEDIAEATRVLESLDGVDRVLAGDALAAAGLHHARAGDLVLTSTPRRWFTWDYWNDDAKAPDYARTVDIHRKPGYDPRELFLDPTLTAPKLKIAGTLLKKKLGFRTLLDVIPLDTTLVRGSHGRTDLGDDRRPVLLSSESMDALPEQVECAAVRDIMLDLLFD
jgi:predicted AlkP superfamily pyrophosphatase or phosphodiesterase